MSDCDPMDYSLPGSSVHGILQARILEWVAIPFSRGIPEFRDWSWVSCIAGRFFTIRATREAPYLCLCMYVCVSVCGMWVRCVLSHVQLFVTHGPQANSLWPTKLFCPWNFPRKNTGAGCHFLLQGSFPIQRVNLCLLRLQNWQVDSLPLAPYIYGLSWWLSKESACNAGDLGLIPRLGRSPGEGNSYPLQYSGLENYIDRGAWQATVHGIAELDLTEQLSYIFVMIRRLYFYIKWNIYLFSLPNSFRICVNLMFEESYSHYI